MSFIQDYIQESYLDDIELMEEEDIIDSSDELEDIDISSDWLSRIDSIKDELDDLASDIETEVEPEDEEIISDEPITEEVIQESKLVDIEDYLEKQNYTESFHINEEVELPNRHYKGRKGSPEYNANEGRRKRVATYRRLAKLDSDEPITEDNINSRIVSKVCTAYGCSPEQLRKELLRQSYTGLERYEED